MCVWRRRTEGDGDCIAGVSSRWQFGPGAGAQLGEECGVLSQSREEHKRQADGLRCRGAFEGSPGCQRAGRWRGTEEGRREAWRVSRGRTQRWLSAGASVAMPSQYSRKAESEASEEAKKSASGGTGAQRTACGAPPNESFRLSCEGRASRLHLGYP